MNKEEIFRNGDRVWDCILDKWGTVAAINNAYAHSVVVVFDNTGKSSTYTNDGRYYIEDVRPRLYFDRFDFPPPPPRPKKRVEKTGWINIYPNGFWSRLYSSYEEAREYAGNNSIDTVQVTYHVEE